MNTIKKFPVWFSRQRLSARIFLIVWVVFIVIFMCSLLFTVIGRSKQQVPAITATSVGADSVILTTWTPTPTNLPIFTNTPRPTPPPLPTGLAAQSLDTATAVIIIPPTIIAATRGSLVVIPNVDKRLEYVDIQNVSYSAVLLTGWVLASETGNQACILRGNLKPREVLRIWAGTGQVGISCGFHNLIWLDEKPDPAVLYNPKGEEVSRYPQP